MFISYLECNFFVFLFFWEVFIIGLKLWGVGIYVDPSRRNDVKGKVDVFLTIVQNQLKMLLANDPSQSSLVG